MLQEPHGRLIVDIHHDRGVERDTDTEFLHQINDSEVLHENGVRLDFVKVEQIFSQGDEFVLTDEIVDCDIEANLMGVRILDGASQRSIVEIHILTVQAHVK